MSDEILLEVKSSVMMGPIMTKGIITVKDDGVHLTFEGPRTLFTNNNSHIPFENISSIDTVKKQLGLYYSIIITEMSGHKHEIQALKKDDAMSASKFILEMKAYSQKTAQNNYNSNSVDFTQQLLNLAKLKDAGILSQEEFETQKNNILSKM
jgi:hypothetical protein